MNAMLLAALGLMAPAIDYAKIDRKIGKEPAYRTGRPLYALLLFGREAKLRAWAVLDGKVLYLDRNGDGDLTGKDERFATLEDCKNVTLADPDGKTRYVIAGIGTYQETNPEGTMLMASVAIKGPVEYEQYCCA